MNDGLMIAILVVGGIIAAVSQLLLKKSAQKQHKNIVSEYINPYVIVSYGLLFATTIINIIAMQQLSFKLVSIISSTSYVFVVLFSKWLLKEDIKPKKSVGVVLIIVGLVLFNL